MGQIQNAIQGLVGATVAGEIVKAKKEKEIATAKAAEQKQIKEDYTVALEAIPRTNEEIAKLEGEQEKLLKEIDLIKRGSKGNEQKFDKELKMRELAIDTLRGKIEAKRIRTEAYKQAIERFKGGGK